MDDTARCGALHGALHGVSDAPHDDAPHSPHGDTAGDAGPITMQLRRVPPPFPTPTANRMPRRILCGQHIGPRPWQWCALPTGHDEGCAETYPAPDDKAGQATGDDTADDGTAIADDTTTPAVTEAAA